jgi:hypothetical protein
MNRRESPGVQGNLVVREGQPIRLRGTNLGNWMILEASMADSVSRKLPCKRL